MDEFFAQLIANVAEARAKREQSRKGPAQAPGSAAVPPTLRTASGPAGPPARPERPLQPAPRPAPPAATTLRATTASSAIEAADPFAAVAAAAQQAVPSSSSLLAAFANRDDLLAGIVLSETLAPPLALRRERDR